MSIDFLIKGKRILTPQGFMEGMILVRQGKIADVLRNVDYTIASPVEDAGENLVMPGIIDPHVHINEPGRTEWEGFDTGTKAAAAGGITTLVDMPLNSSPVTTTIENFKLKLESAKNKIHVNCGFWGGVIPGNEKDLEALLESGVFGLKAFLTHSGIDEFPNTNKEQLRKALLILKKFNKPLLVHCELAEDHEGLKLLEQNPKSYSAYLESRPKSWEDEAIKLMIDLCRETESHVHIVHLSSADSISQIREAKAEGLPLTVETAPHYLVFDAASIADGDTRFKCAPPIREKENNEQLWQALQNGEIDLIATDHSPAPPELKEIESGDFKKAWGGIAGLQFSLPVISTAALKRRFTIENISKWMISNPAKLLQLDHVKGKIQKGFDTDLIIWNPNEKFHVVSSSILHRHKITPYENLELTGKVQQTFVNGIKVNDNGNLINPASGKILLKN